MTNRLIRASALVFGAALLSTITAVAQDDPRFDPATFDAPATCHTSVDPGFVARIEDRSNDKGFVATFEDISNDSGFLQPVPAEPGRDGDAPAPCAAIAPLPWPGQP